MVDPKKKEAIQEAEAKQSAKAKQAAKAKKDADTKVDTASDKPTDKPVEKKVDKPVDKKVDTPVVKPDDKPVDKPAADKPAEKGEEPPKADEGFKKDEKETAATNGTDAKKEKKQKKSSDGAAPGEPQPKRKAVIPPWASLSSSEKSRLQQNKEVSVKVNLQEEILNAIKNGADSKGKASAQAIKKILFKRNPNIPSHFLKMAIKRAVDKGVIIQNKGKGLNGLFSVGKKVAEKKTKAKFEDVLPLVMTWACNPKESSVTLIKKYLSDHFPQLDTEGSKFKKALMAAEERGQLERITGKGLSGTFALVDGAKKTGGAFEDAFESAIIAMNEPKTASIQAIRDYMREYNKDITIVDRPKMLKVTLERLESQGWIKRESGKGLTGQISLAHKYYPSPKELWGDEYVEPAKPQSKTQKPKRRAYDSDDDDDDSESEESSESESDDDYVGPTPKNRSIARPAMAMYTSGGGGSKPRAAPKKNSRGKAPAAAKKAGKKPAKSAAKKRR